MAANKCEQLIVLLTFLFAFVFICYAYPNISVNAISGSVIGVPGYQVDTNWLTMILSVSALVLAVIYVFLRD